MRRGISPLVFVRQLQGKPYSDQWDGRGQDGSVDLYFGPTKPAPFLAWPHRCAANYWPEALFKALQPADQTGLDGAPIIIDPGLTNSSRDGLKLVTKHA
jgi:hypothetical protein